jgi:hypothetical protein
MIKSKTKKRMTNAGSSFNPARLNDQIDGSFYPTGFGKGPKLKRERRDRIDWLRNKYKDNRACQSLAKTSSTPANGEHAANRQPAQSARPQPRTW